MNRLAAKRRDLSIWIDDYGAVRNEAKWDGFELEGLTWIQCLACDGEIDSRHAFRSNIWSSLSASLIFFVVTRKLASAFSRSLSFDLWDCLIPSRRISSCRTSDIYLLSASILPARLSMTTHYDTRHTE